ncbi:MAG: hypothetical protein D5R97_05200 [Candidatus Syntrophonatronum acetioxidans]|uniref:Uncharacterized protein n=1 Tax=Candidatus Syntrophonatronum acetioxidans TaxID=1795816 RepID=A0A424YEM2_9FIRM|nr:MAG: hypothetical protein D5R97_05200 [Candidatus Syntrophonatronum acetioxidans]
MWPRNEGESRQGRQRNRPLRGPLWLAWQVIFLIQLYSQVFNILLFYLFLTLVVPVLPLSIREELNAVVR